MPGLAPEPEIIIDYADVDPDVPEFDDAGNVLRIANGDGSLTLSLDGQPLNNDEPDTSPDTWFANLVGKIDSMERSRISETLLRGIEDDKTSRQQWIENTATAVRLLGLTLEVPSLQGSSDGAPLEGMSKVRHPLLLEAVLRFQANARSELLPTDGPVKVRNDTTGSANDENALANALETDLNHYLTAVAKEYYPDTDRMLLKLGLCGTQFKKVYFCPLRNRPVSETVDVDDLIVNNAATDLSDAKRITHRIMMRPSTVRRMQILGVYRDIDLSTPNAANLDSLQREEKNQQGVSANTDNPDDRDREIYECYCELDIKGYEHRHKQKVSGLEIPYRVTIDLTSREILSIVRNYNEGCDALPTARVVFVKYTFVPGFGFYDIGLQHILGNTTNALTAAWREMLDAGMFANFPGFLVAQNGTRQNTTNFRVPPGGGAQVNTGGQKIGDAIMALPYKTPDPAFMAFIKDVGETGMRIGGTSEQQVGEGRADAPVGTTLAMIEQATKVLNSVHKRMHAAQAIEFGLLADCFRENPESLWERGCKSDTQWSREMFLAALDDCDLVPQADPNTASHSQRVMKIMALKQLQAANQTLYDPVKVDTAALQAIGWNNPEQFFVAPQKRDEPAPEVQEKIAKLGIEKQDADTRAAVGNATVAEKMAKAGAREAGPDPEAGLKARGLEIQHADVMLDAQNRAADRESRENIAALGLAKELISQGIDADTAGREAKEIEGETQ